ncbi:AI-2E family transporter [Candidatus Gracilibacteria bacterium]|nr:AI-2E family transporter [Candidatus Gracilibacteria bacterium]
MSNERSVAEVSGEVIREDELASRARFSGAQWRRLMLAIQGITPSRLIQFALVIGAIYGISLIVQASFGALIPFFFGALLAYLFLPLVDRVEQVGTPRWAAILLVFSLALLAVALFISFIIPPVLDQFNSLLRALPNTEKVERWMAQIQVLIATLPPEAQTFIYDGLNQALETLRTNLATYVRNVFTFLTTSLFGLLNTLGFLLGFFIIPFWLFYVLKDAQHGQRSLNNSLPSWIRGDFWAMLRIIDKVFSSYIRAQLLLGLIIGICTFVGLSLLQLFGVEGIQYTLLLAVWAGITELIPFVGPVLGAIPALLIASAVSWQSVLAVLLLYIIIQQLEGNVLVPKVTGDSLRIHPAILMVLLIVMSQFGFIWIVLAGPIAATARDLFLYIYGRFDEPPRPAGMLPDERISMPTKPSVSEAEGERAATVKKREA